MAQNGKEKMQTKSSRFRQNGSVESAGQFGDWLSVKLKHFGPRKGGAIIFTVKEDTGWETTSLDLSVARLRFLKSWMKRTGKDIASFVEEALREKLQSARV